MSEDFPEGSTRSLNPISPPVSTACSPPPPATCADDPAPSQTRAGHLRRKPSGNPPPTHRAVPAG
jgi:hypothetical protein